MQHSSAGSAAHEPHPSPQASPHEAPHGQDSHAHASPQQHDAASAHAAGLGDCRGRKEINSMVNVNMTSPF